MPVPPSRSGNGRPHLGHDGGIPSFRYSGGKASLRGWIVPYFPRRCGVYCEPFAGRGNVFFLAQSVLDADAWWLNDVRTAPFFKALVAADLSKMPASVPYSDKDEWVSRVVAGEPLAVAMEPFISWCGGGVMHKGFTGDGKHHKKGIARYALSRGVNELYPAKEILVRTMPEVTAWDYKLALSLLEPGDFAYVDPPYFNAKVHPYSDYGMIHSEMVDILLKAKFRWVLSEYDQTLYRDAFGPPVATRSSQANSGKNRGWRVECLWHNHGKVV